MKPKDRHWQKIYRAITPVIIIFFLTSTIPLSTANSASSPADSYSDLQRKTLEHLTGRVKNESQFVVINDGEVPARVTHVIYRMSGGTERVDVPDIDLIPNQSHPLPIDHDYSRISRIAVLSARGVLYPIKMRPTADFSYSPSSPEAGETVTFDASASFDPDGVIASYEWDLDDDGAYDDASGVTASRVFTNEDTHTIRLKVTDDDELTDTVSNSITVEIPDTTIEGTTEPGAPVTVVVSSEPRVYNLYADESGYFKVVVHDLGFGRHTVKVVAGDANRNESADGPYKGGWKGYVEREESRTLKAGDHETFNLRLTFDPFDFKLSSSSGRLSRGYSSHTRYLRRSYGSRILDGWKTWKTNVSPDEAKNYRNRSNYRVRPKTIRKWRATYFTDLKNHSDTYDTRRVARIARVYLGYRSNRALIDSKIREVPVYKYVITWYTSHSQTFNDESTAKRYAYARGHYDPSVTPSRWKAKWYTLEHHSHTYETESTAELAAYARGRYNGRVTEVPQYKWRYKAKWTTREWNPHHKWHSGHWYRWTTRKRVRHTYHYYTWKRVRHVYYTWRRVRRCSGWWWRHCWYTWRRVRHVYYTWRRVRHTGHYYTYKTVHHKRWIRGHWVGGYETVTHTRWFDSWWKAWRKGRIVDRKRVKYDTDYRVEWDTRNYDSSTYSTKSDAISATTRGNRHKVRVKPIEWKASWKIKHVEKYDSPLIALLKKAIVGGEKTRVRIDTDYKLEWTTGIRHSHVFDSKSTARNVAYGRGHHEGSVEPVESKVYTIKVAKWKRPIYKRYHKSYSWKPWKSISTTVRVISKNNYKGSVKLSTPPVNGINARLASNMITLSSSRSTTLKMTPHSTRGTSSHSIPVEGLAKNERDEHIEKTNYNLDLSASKPRSRTYKNFWKYEYSKEPTPPQPETVTLTVNVNGPGSVHVQSKNDTVYSSQSFQYNVGSTETLDANLDSNFDKWTGDLHGQYSIKSITMDSDKSVTAHFSKTSEYTEYKYRYELYFSLYDRTNKKLKEGYIWLGKDYGETFEISKYQDNPPDKYDAGALLRLDYTNTTRKITRTPNTATYKTYVYYPYYGIRNWKYLGSGSVVLSGRYEEDLTIAKKISGLTTIDYGAKFLFVIQ